MKNVIKDVLIVTMAALIIFSAFGAAVLHGYNPFDVVAFMVMAPVCILFCVAFTQIAKS